MKYWIKQFVDKYIIFSVADEDRLTDGERQSLRQEFIKFLDTHPLPERKFAYSFSAALPQVALMFALLIGGTAYVADSAGPTDPLYTVKRNVNEQIMLGLSSVSPSFRAEVDSILLARRLQEAETLIVENTSEGMLEVFSQEINERTAALNRYIETIEERGNISEAIALDAQLDALLDEHNANLHDLLAEERSEAHNTSIESFIRELEDTLNERRVLHEDESKTTVTKDSGHIKILDEVEYALTELDTVAGAWHDERELYKEALGPQIYENSGEMLAAAEDALARARTRIKEGNVESVLSELETAYTQVQSAATMIRDTISREE
jgi:hypothetical protein